MNLATILSDLTSLRVCDPAAAMALVSARPDSKTSDTKLEPAQHDPDLARVEALLQLHQTVKLAYTAGSKPGNLSDEFKDLRQARAQVRNVLQQLSTAPANAVPPMQESNVNNDDDDETEAWS